MTLTSDDYGFLMIMTYGDWIDVWSRGWTVTSREKELLAKTEMRVMRLTMYINTSPASPASPFSPAPDKCI